MESESSEQQLEQPEFVRQLIVSGVREVNDNITAWFPDKANVIAVTTSDQYLKAINVQDVDFHFSRDYQAATITLIQLKTVPKPSEILLHPDHFQQTTCIMMPHKLEFWVHEVVIRFPLFYSRASNFAKGDARI